ncbi:MAG: lysophospholipid acyltransferase family protein [Deltaproteobacteria bacterium]|nr:lysophospholipid acyltransferase family protein [Deltaproteobacteria bacterium]
MSLKSIIRDVFKLSYLFPLRIIVQKIPFKWTFLLARWGGSVAYLVLRRKRKAFERELYCIAPISNAIDMAFEIKNTFINTLQNELELLLYPTLNKGNIDSIIVYNGMEHLDRAIKAGNGTMLVFAHFGANQMIMPAIGYRDYKMCQMSAPSTIWEEKLPNRKFSRIEKLGLRIRWEYEQSLPVTHINIFGSMKEAFLCLKRNDILGIALDGGGGKKKVSVDFLGKKALFAVGAMEIAMRSGCAVLPTFMIRGKDGRHTMIIESPLEIYTKEQCEDAVEKNTLAFVKKLEKYVLRHPSHYLNFLALRRFMEAQGDAPFLVSNTNNRMVNS